MHPNSLINDICAKICNPSYCSGVLKSDRTTDLKALGQYTIKIANTEANAAFKLAQSLVQKESDPKLKKNFESCSENFDNAIGDLEQAKEYLYSGDYLGVNVSGSAAMTEADTCSDDLPKTAKSSPLLRKIKVVDDTCSIVEVIGNLLRGATH